MITNIYFWWIANLPEKGQRPRSHVSFLREWLPRAAAKLGEAPGLILCNPADRDALAELAGYTIGTNANIAPGNFWIGAKPKDAPNGERSSETAEEN